MMSVNGQVIFLIGLSALVAGWAFRHFHEPYRIEDVRFSVSRSRYWIALWLHMTAVLAVYGALTAGFYSVAALALPNCASSDMQRYVP